MSEIARKPFAWLNETSRVFLERGYLSEGEDPIQRYRTIADKAEEILGIDGYADKFFDYMGRGWFSLASPVIANFGKKRGLPISCFNSHIGDSVGDILFAQAEVGVMSKVGGGTSGYFGVVRPRGSEITDNGHSTGTVHFMELFQAATNVISQGNTRRGKMSPYLPASHGDIDEFLDIGKENSEIQDMNHGVVLDDEWLNSMIEGDAKDPEVIKKRRTWAKIIQRRTELGYPYLMFRDNANNNTVDVYKDKNYKINSSNLCVAGDTKVLTKDGYKEINTLVGQTVPAWNGKEWTDAFFEQTSEGQEVLDVELSTGVVIKATPYHKWYVAKQNARGELRGEILKRTSELKEGDKLIKFDLSPVDHGTKTLQYAYQKGFFTADGTYQNERTSRIALYSDKKDLVYKFVGATSVSEDSYGRINVVYQREELGEKYFVPSSEYTVASRLEWLAGFMDGVGTLTDNKGEQSIQVVSTNHEFLMDVLLMLQELGIYSVIVDGQEAGYKLLPANDGTGEYKEFWCKKAHRLLIPGSSLNNLLDLGYNGKRVQPYKHTYNRNATRFITVRSVVDNEEVIPTYCGNEPKTNKLMFNGVVTGNCSEIYLPSSDEESFVCVLSSMNLLYYDEWKDTDAVETLIFFLDAVITEFLEKLEVYRDSEEREDNLIFQFMERAYNFSKRHRALGMGTLALHSLFQEKMISFESREAAKLNLEIFKNIQKQSYKASEKLAELFGEPEVLKGYGRRNTTTMAIAPTASSSTIMGQVSPGIEPWFSNYFIDDKAKVKIPMKNHHLEALLEKKGHNTREVWEQIMKDDGSVFGLSDDILSEEEKEVFLTYPEINQRTIIDMAAVRQEYIDQGQSLNLYVPGNLTARELSELHLHAWRMGLKSLYYLHSTNASQQFLRKRNTVDCVACDG